MHVVHSHTGSKTSTHIKINFFKKKKQRKIKPATYEVSVWANVPGGIKRSWGALTFLGEDEVDGSHSLNSLLIPENVRSKVGCVSAFLLTLLVRKDRVHESLTRIYQTASAILSSAQQRDKTCCLSATFTPSPETS